MSGIPTWARDLPTGVAELDVEHQLQVNLVETLLQAVAAGKPRPDVDALLQVLLDTSNVHFLAEELLMRMHSWERYTQHTEEHRHLLEELQAMRASFEAGESSTLSAIAMRVQAWLANHIRTHDHAFADYMANGGLGASGA